MNFDNSYARLAEEFHAAVEPGAVEAPSMLVWNHNLAAELGFDSLAQDEREPGRKKGRSIDRPLVTANRSQSEFEFESNLNLIHRWQCEETFGIDAVLEIVE